MRLWLIIQGVRFLWWVSEKCSSRMYLQNNMRQWVKEKYGPEAPRVEAMMRQFGLPI